MQCATVFCLARVSVLRVCVLCVAYVVCFAGADCSDEEVLLRKFDMVCFCVVFLFVICVHCVVCVACAQDMTYGPCIGISRRDRCVCVCLLLCVRFSFAACVHLFSVFHCVFLCAQDAAGAGERSCAAEIPVAAAGRQKHHDETRLFVGKHHGARAGGRGTQTARLMLCVRARVPARLCGLDLLLTFAPLLCVIYLLRFVSFRFCFEKE